MAGGKGVNAARAIRVLGGESTCMGFLGGHAGQLAAGLINQEGMLSSWTWIEGETRTCSIVIEMQEDGVNGNVKAKRRDATVLNTNGPQVGAEDWVRLEESILQRACNGDLVAFCGSLPPGIHPENLRQLLIRLALIGCKTWVDSSGAALVAAHQANPNGIKVNAQEMSELLGKKIKTLRQARSAARKALCASNPLQSAQNNPVALNFFSERMVAVTAGAAGALLCRGDACWAGYTPPVRAISSVGSGDTFFGALLWSIEQGIEGRDALKNAIAAGAANALLPGSGRFSLEDFRRLLDETTVETMDKS
jgi:1-phosphofructokinase family hexose kinase